MAVRTKNDSALLFSVLQMGKSRSLKFLAKIELGAAYRGSLMRQLF